MLPLITALWTLFQPTAINDCVRTSFYRDLIEYYVPDGGEIDLRSPFGDVPTTLLMSVHKSATRAVTVSTGKIDSVPPRKLQVIVINLMDDLLEVNKTMIGISPFAESRIALLLPSNYSEENMLVVLSSCWRNSFGTCLAVTQPDPRENNYEIYHSSLEFKKNQRCFLHHAPPTLINRWVYGKGFERGKALSISAIKDFKGCNVLVAHNNLQPYFARKSKHSSGQTVPLVEFQGIDAGLLGIIAKRYNFIVRGLSMAEVYRRKNESSNNVKDDNNKNRPKGPPVAFLAVMRHEADVVAGGFTPGVGRFRWMDTTWPYYRDELKWYTTPLEEVMWHRLTTCFTSTAWICVSVAFCATSIMRLLLSSGKDDPCPVLTLWSLCTESGRHPNYRLLSEFVLAIAWIILSLHVNTAYRAGLATTLAAGVVYDDMTQSDIYTSDYTLFIPIIYRAFFSSLFENHRGVQREYPWNGHINCLQNMKTGYKKAILTNKNLMMTEGSVILRDNETGMPTFRTVQGQVLGYPVQMYLAKGHILTSIFDETLKILTDAGFPGHFLRDACSRAARRARKGYVLMEGDSLTFGHLQGAFVALAAGLVVASVTFIWEIWYARYKRRFENTESEID